MGKLLGYLSEEGLGGILLQVRVADGDEGGHRRREKTSLEIMGVSTGRSSWLGSAKSYENKDAICTSLPVFHIFIVKLQCTGDIHREDGSRRITILGFLLSGNIFLSGGAIVYVL